MIGFEFRKVISNTRIILLTSFLFLLNIVLIACQIFLPNEDGYSERDINRIYREMGDNQASYISQQISSILTPGTATSITEENIEEIMTSLSLYLFVEAEVAQINSYSDYLDSISSEADRMEGAGLLFQEDSFSARNIADISDKLTAVFGELKAAVQKKVAEKFNDIKKKVKSIFKIFENTDDDDKKVEETKRTFELKTFIHKLYKKLKDGEKDENKSI